ncbi:hypothetical protein SESBI_41889, partial [Sesbania bispinosa]
WLMMRCFLPCFRDSKRRKHSRSANANPTRGGGQTHVVEGALEPAIQLIHQKTVVVESIDCVAESKKEIEEQSNNIVEVTSTNELTKNIEEANEEEQEKKVAREEKTPQIGEKKDSHEEGNYKGLPHEESSDSLFSLSICSGKQVSAAEIEVNSPVQLPCAVCTKKEVSEEAFGSSPSVPERDVQHVSSALNPLENLPQGKPSEKEETKLVEEQPSCIAMTKVNPNEEPPSAKELMKKLEENKEEKGKARETNHPVPEYRYRDCSDEGYEDVNLDDSDFDVKFGGEDPHNEKKGEGVEEDADVNRTWVPEESSESLFSLSTDSRKRISISEKAENEVNSLQANVTDVSSVLNPIENLTQGKGVKTTKLQHLENDKENINFVVQDFDIPISPEPNLKLSNRKQRQKINDKKQEIGVDTSLSSWLVESETTPISMNSTNSTPKGGIGSPWSHEDRPILGALTLEEIRKYSISTSSRRSRSRSPDETPIIGTVGSYWSHTGQSMRSKFSEKDAKPEWRTSTTLKTRLEPAFEASVADI